MSIPTATNIFVFGFELESVLALKKMNKEVAWMTEHMTGTTTIPVVDLSAKSFLIATLRLIKYFNTQKSRRWEMWREMQLGNS